jgi:hypothetical protein
MNRQLYEAEPHDDMRCKGAGTGAEGQCRYLSMKGMIREGFLEDEPSNHQDYCPKHGKTRAMAQQKKEYHDYLSGQWQMELEKFASSDKVKSLRGELGVLRLLVQKTLEKCQTADDLLMYSTKLASLAMQIEKLVVSCDKLEVRMGELLTREVALSFASSIISILQEYVKDDMVLDQIATKILASFKDLTNKELTL